MKITKIDYMKEFHELYNPNKETVSDVKIPSMNYIMIDGKGNPNTSKEFLRQ